MALTRKQKLRQLSEAHYQWQRSKDASPGTLPEDEGEHTETVNATLEQEQQFRQMLKERGVID